MGDQVESFRERSRRNQLEKQKRTGKIIVGSIAGVFLLTVVVGIAVCKGGKSKDTGVVEHTAEVTATQVPTAEPTKEPWSFEAVQTENTQKFGNSVVSSKGVLIDVDNKEILAAKGTKKQMYPASMTKILTVLVAAEHVTEEQLDDKVKITIDITDYCYSNDCSAVGFAKNETVPVRDLFYGTILPSGADAAVALANYVAGSHEEFVKLMNEKLEELRIAETTHFTNCVGLYADDHYSTPYDMALIMKAASENELCQKVLNARTYTTAKTKKHKDGILISNWFLRRIEDKDTNSEILYAKTGFVNQSGSCAASMAQDKNGHTYICVTAGSTSSWRCIYDHVELYHKFIK